MIFLKKIYTYIISHQLQVLLHRMAHTRGGKSSAHVEHPYLDDNHGEHYYEHREHAYDIHIEHEYDILSTSHSTCLSDPLTLLSCGFRIDIDWKMYC